MWFKLNKLDNLPSSCPIRLRQALDKHDPLDEHDAIEECGALDERSSLDNNNGDAPYKWDAVDYDADNGNDRNDDDESLFSAHDDGIACDNNNDDDDDGVNEDWSRFSGHDDGATCDDDNNNNKSIDNDNEDNVIDDDSLSTAALLFDGVDFGPIIEDLRLICLNRHMRFDGTYYSVESDFSVSKSEIRFTMRSYPDSFFC